MWHSHSCFKDVQTDYGGKITNGNCILIFLAKPHCLGSNIQLLFSILYVNWYTVYLNCTVFNTELCASVALCILQFRFLLPLTLAVSCFILEMVNTVPPLLNILLLNTFL